MVSADLAMYAAKEAGGNRYHVATNDGGEYVSGMQVRLNWADQIRRALDEDRFVLYCQPILELATDSVTQYELLLRMIGDDGEIVMPAAFIDTAERFGLIQEIDQWVAREAIHLLAEHDVRLEVNVSGKSMDNLAIPELVEREIAATGIDPSRLVFEITETAAIANMEQARAFAERLTRLGCRFALDDFGAGFSSFYYLKYLPLDYLKIDGDFIRSLTSSVTDQLVVKSMVDIARGMGMKTIAEFVEAPETVAMLREKGVDYSQGYFHGAPRPVTDGVRGAGARAMSGDGRPGSAGRARPAGEARHRQACQRLLRQPGARSPDAADARVHRADEDGFIATSDAHGECDTSFRAGPPGFVRVIDEQTVMWPEYKGNGVMASMGNIAENGYVGLLFVDFFETAVGLHVNGTATVVENAAVEAFGGAVRPAAVRDRRWPTSEDTKKTPERWVVVSIDEAYIHCSKHIPHLQYAPEGEDAGRRAGDVFKAKNADRAWLQPTCEIELPEEEPRDRRRQVRRRAGADARRVGPPSAAAGRASRDGYASQQRAVRHVGPPSPLRVRSVPS